VKTIEIKKGSIIQRKGDPPEALSKVKGDKLREK
jgi:hypothetical protein